MIELLLFYPSKFLSFENLVRLLIQLINGISTGPMSRNIQASHTLKEVLTHKCRLRNDELALLMEIIFRHLKCDDDDATSLSQNLKQTAIKVREIKISRNLIMILF